MPPPLPPLCFLPDDDDEEDDEVDDDDEDDDCDVELLPGEASSKLDVLPFCCSALTISCFASEVFVPGLVRLIFIFNPLSSVA